MGSAPIAVKPEIASKAKTIGIISVVGDDLAYRNVPVFRWDQEEHFRNVNAWAMDDHVTAEMAKILQPGREIIAVDFDRAAFRVSRDSVFGFMTPNDIAKAMAANVRGSKPDLYLVVLQSRAGFETSGTPAEGMGVLRRPVLGGDLYYLHAIYSITVVDGPTNKILASAEAVDGSRSPWSSVLHGAPYDEFEEEHWAVENEDVNSAQIDWVRDRMKALFARTLPTTLQRLKVI